MILEVTEKQFTMTPLLFLLNHSSGDLFDTGTKSLLMSLSFLEKLIHALNHKPDTFWRIWTPLCSFLQNLWLLESGRHWLTAPRMHTLYLCPSVPHVYLIIHVNIYVFIAVFFCFFSFLKLNFFLQITVLVLGVAFLRLGLLIYFLLFYVVISMFDKLKD